MTKPLMEIINEKYKDMSKTNKKLSDYIKNNIYKLPFLTISELSQDADVSPASITRYVRLLGYKGYSEFQNETTHVVKQNVTPMKEVKDSISNEELTDDNILEYHINNNIDGLNSMLNKEVLENYEKAIDILKDSKRIFIVAARSSFSVGYYLYFMLKGFKDNVCLLESGTKDASNILTHITSEDTLISISYSRYTKFTYDITEFFYDEGCKIVSITDSYTSPIGELSDSILLAKNMNNSYTFVNAMVMANAIVTSLGRLDRDNTIKTLERQSQIAVKQNIYL